jgi:NADP-dependent 3-hydroxy acid dehydrogenase YdfG
MEEKPYNIRTSIISPGAVATELLNSISDPEVSAANRAYVATVAVPADSFARAVSFAVSQPAELDINEILFRPTNHEF